MQERVKSQLTPKELMELEDESGEPAANSAKLVNIPIPTFPPTAAVCAVPPATQSTDVPLLRHVNTVPMSLVARALLPPENEWSPRRRLGDSYVCSVCRRCDSAVDGGSQPATLHVTNEEHPFQTNPGVHHARKSPTQPNLTLTRSWCLLLVIYAPCQLQLECWFTVCSVHSLTLHFHWISCFNKGIYKFVARFFFWTECHCTEEVLCWFYNSAELSYLWVKGFHILNILCS